MTALGQMTDKHTRTCKHTHAQSSCPNMWCNQRPYQGNCGAVTGSLTSPWAFFFFYRGNWPRRVGHTSLTLLSAHSILHSLFLLSDCACVCVHVCMYAWCFFFFFFYLRPPPPSCSCSYSLISEPSVLLVLAQFKAVASRTGQQGLSIKEPQLLWGSCSSAFGHRGLIMVFV